MGELDSNEWGGTPGESPRPTHTICVLCQVLYFSEKILGENLVVFCRVSFPYPHSACLVAKRDAIPIVALHLRPGVFEEFSLSFVPLLYHKSFDLSRGFLRSKWIRTTIRSAQICNTESNRFASGSLSSTSLLYSYCITTYRICQLVILHKQLDRKLCKLLNKLKFCSPPPPASSPNKGAVIRYCQTLRLVKCLRQVVRVYEIARFCPPLTYSGDLRRVFSTCPPPTTRLFAQGREP